MEANEQIPLAPGAHDPDFAKEAKEHQKAYKYMLEKSNKTKSLQNKLLDALPDLHEEAFSKINCLDCARCCKNHSPRFKQPDIKRIAKSLRMKEGDLVWATPPISVASGPTASASAMAGMKVAAASTQPQPVSVAAAAGGALAPATQAADGQSLTPEQRDQMRKRMESMTPEERAEAMRKRMEAMTPEQRQQFEERRRQRPQGGGQVGFGDVGGGGGGPGGGGGGAAPV